MIRGVSIQQQAWSFMFWKSSKKLASMIICLIRILHGTFEHGQTGPAYCQSLQPVAFGVATLSCFSAEIHPWSQGFYMLQQYTVMLICNGAAWTPMFAEFVLIQCTVHSLAPGNNGTLWHCEQFHLPESNMSVNAASASILWGKEGKTLCTAITRRRVSWYGRL